jgi:poly(3-hydroxybutyrate) depolymerase
MKSIKIYKAGGQILFSVLLALASYNVMAQPAEIENKFLYKAHQYNGVTIPYRLFVPENYDSTKVYPVVLALHGWGECGSDNNLQIHVHRLATAWADSANQALHPCFVVAPQGPLDTGWYDANVMANVYDLLDSMVTHFSIDTNRQYITGLSMGGYMTWMSISSFPDRFAAAVPMSGWKDNPEDVSAIKNVPVWDVHGQNDGTVTVDNSRVLIEGLESLGRQAVYTNQRYRKAISLSDSALENQIDSHVDLIYSEVAGSSHGDLTWTNYYNNPLLVKWVFDQHRRDTSAIALSNFLSYKTIREQDTIKWTSAFAKDTVELWFSPDNGKSWDLIAASAPNTGEFVWDVTGEEDCVAGQIKIFLKDSAGHVFGADRSENFAIDNASNGKPFIQILDNEIITTYTIAEDSLEFFFRTGDPECTELDLTLYYSSDKGITYTKFDSTKISGDLHFFSRWIKLNTLEYSTASFIKAGISDGQYVSYDSTLRFKNSNGIEPTFISDFNINSNVSPSCYPNPTSGIINIDADSPMEISVTDISGRLLIHQNNKTSNAVLDLSGYGKGLLMVKVKTDKGIFIKRVVVR